jgi:profilin
MPGQLQADGATIVKTKQAILVAEYAAPLQSGESAPVVEKLADYLISVNY